MLWYVVRCFQKEFAPIWQRLEKAGFEVNYFQVDGLPYLFFLQARRIDARRIARDFPALHFYKVRTGARLTLVPVSDDIIEMLQIVVAAHDPNVMYKEEGCLDHLAGKEVVVVGGEFYGVIGKRCRIQGEHHVCFNVPGACTVCTPYIPSEFIIPL